MTECPPHYEPRRPEATTLYRVFQRDLETFLAQAQDEDGRCLPGFVERELRRFLECGILAHGFARVRCRDCAEDLLVPYSCKLRGFCPSCCGRRMASTAAHLRDAVLPLVPIRHAVFTLPAPIRFLLVYRPVLADVCLARYLRTLFEWATERTRASVDPRTGCGAVTIIQRFSSNLGLFLHWHSLLLSGVFVPGSAGALTFHPLPDPGAADLRQLEARLARDIVECLEKKGVLEEGEIAIPAEEFQANTLLQECQSASLQNRVAFGPRRGLPIRRESAVPLARCFEAVRVGSTSGFSFFLGQPIGPDDRDRLERVARYISRPPLTDERLSFTADGKVRLSLSRPAKDGTTALIFDGPELIERLAALIPPPRRNLLRYHGILAPNAAWRSSSVVPRSGTSSDRAAPPPPGTGSGPWTLPAQLPPRPRRGAPRTGPRWLRWAELLRRVFRIDVLECPKCHGRREVIGFVVDPESIHAILSHLGLPTAPPPIEGARRSRRGSPTFEG